MGGAVADFRAESLERILDLGAESGPSVAAGGAAQSLDARGPEGAPLS